MNLVHQNATKSGYDLLIKWVFGIWLLNTTWDPMIDLAHFPKELYQPTGLLLFFFPHSLSNVILSLPFLLVFKISLLTCLCFVVFNHAQKKVFALTSCLLLTFYQSLIRSFGHINHPELMLLYSAYILTVCFYFEDSYIKENKQINGYSIPFILIMFFLGLTYAFAGIHRIAKGGVDIFANDSLLYWVIENSNRARLIPMQINDVIYHTPWFYQFSKFGFVLVTIVEILSPIILVSRRFRYFWFLVIIPFHLFVFVSMGILFWENLLVILVFFERFSNPQRISFFPKISLK